MMKVTAVSVGVCIVLSIIAMGECAFSLSKRQATVCGDPTDPNTPIGRCTTAGNTGDVTTICSGCVSVFRNFYDCARINGDVLLNELQQACDNLGSVPTATTSSSACSNSELNFCSVELAAQNNDVACSSNCRAVFGNYISQCAGQSEAQSFNDIITDVCGSNSGAATTTPAVITLSSIVVLALASYIV